MANVVGIVIEESLVGKEVLQKLKIVETKVEAVTEEHRTPWIKQWTLHTIDVPADQAEEVADALSVSLDSRWYADYKNHDFHMIVSRNKVFKVDRSKPEQYKDVRSYGVGLGIPDYQLDFSPQVEG